MTLCCAFYSCNLPGPGQQLAQQWYGDPRNLLLLPEQGPLTATWLQQCLQQQLLPPLQQQQQQWQVQYTPVCSTAGAAAAGVPAAAAVVGQMSGACLTARQLLQLLLQAQQQQQQQRTAQKKGTVAGDVCRVLLSAADRRLLETAMHADG
jgi:hypothetical protein